MAFFEVLQEYRVRAGGREYGIGQYKQGRLTGGSDSTRGVITATHWMIWTDARYFDPTAPPAQESIVFIDGQRVLRVQKESEDPEIVLEIPIKDIQRPTRKLASPFDPLQEGVIFDQSPRGWLRGVNNAPVEQAL